MVWDLRVLQWMLPSGAMGVPGSSKVAGSCLRAIRQAWIDPKKRVSKRGFCCSPFNFENTTRCKVI